MLARVLIHFTLLALHILCMECITTKNIQLHSVRECRSLCERTKSGGNVEVCHCRTGLATHSTVSLIQSARSTAIVCFVKSPVDYWMCREFCSSLEKCQFHYQSQRQECILGQCDRIESASTLPATVSKPTKYTTNRGLASEPQTVSDSTTTKKTLVSEYESSETAQTSKLLASEPTQLTSQITTKGPSVSKPSQPGAKTTKPGTTCDRRCVPPYYICNKGKCECSLVYSRTTDGKCLPGCSSYSNKFTLQIAKTATCVIRKMNKYPNLSSPKRCEENCIQETDFKCSYYKIDEGNCITNRWADKYAKPIYMKNSDNCTQYTRHCDHKGCDETCVPPNYVCYRGKCVCGIAYSRTTDGKCIQGCSSYSNKFSLQRSGADTCLSRRTNEYKLVSSPHKCREKCLKEKEFECVFYEIDGGKCLTTKWKDKYMKPQYKESNDECTHYTRQCNHKGGECDTCHLPKYRCKNGKCICNHGYIRVKHVGTCNKECFSYANTFTQQSTTHCLHEYQKEYTNTSSNTCKRRCLEEGNFICSAYHTYSGNCYLQAWELKWLEKDWSKLKNCMQCRRDCNPSCEEGYSLNQQKNKCVSSCKEYGRKFQKQSMTTCLHIGKKYRNTGEDKCESLCLQSQKVCDGYELRHGNCYVIYEDKVGMGFWKDYKDCVHYQRICRK